MELKFPGRSQRGDDNYAGAYGVNLSEAHDQRERQRREAWSEYQVALARHHGIAEVALADIAAIGESGRRWSVGGVEYRLHEALVTEDVNPAEHGVEFFFVDGAGQVRYLRKPLGVLRGPTRPLSDAAFARQVGAVPTAPGAGVIQ